MRKSNAEQYEYATRSRLILSRRAGVQLLHCVVNEVRGGANALIDGFYVAERLRETAPHHFETLRRVHFMFHREDGANWFVQVRLESAQTKN